MASTVLEIDGSVLEGGGQILRNASALSCILSQSISVNKIRAGRDNPGLRPQHLSGLELLRDLSDGSLRQAKVNSQTIVFCPGKLQGGSFLADTRTAGSICLLIQSALPCMIFARGPSNLVLRGGTNASFAPPVDYLIWILKPFIEKFGISFNCEIKRRGFYPKGGGEVVVSSSPMKSLKSIEVLDRGEVVKITGLAYCAGVLPIKVARSMAETARRTLERRQKGIPIQIDTVKETDAAAFGNGSGIILMAETSTGNRLAGTGLGSRDLKAEDVGQKAAEELLQNLEHGGCVDDYLQDQIIIFMALAQGLSRIRCGQITLHTETAIHVAKLLTKAEFRIVKISDKENIIECDGIGFLNKDF